MGLTPYAQIFLPHYCNHIFSGYYFSVLVWLFISTHVLFTALSMSILTLVAFFRTLQLYGVGKRVLQFLCIVIAVGAVYSGSLALTIPLVIFNILGVGYFISAAFWMATCFNLDHDD